MHRTASPPLTYDAIIDAPDDGNRYEIIDGEMVVTASPNRAHQYTSKRAYDMLNDASDRDRYGMVFFNPIDVRLTPHDIVQPDILFIRRERLHIFTPGGLIEGPPDIVVEVVSPSSRTRDLVTKAKLYARAEVPEYWQADPIAREFTILGLDQGRYTPVPTDDGLMRSLVLPHLRFDVAALFEGI